jgi:hypothetical protein
MQYLKDGVDVREIFSYTHLGEICDIIVYKNECIRTTLGPSHRAVCVRYDDPRACQIVLDRLNELHPRRIVLCCEKDVMEHVNKHVCDRLPKTKSVVLLLTLNGSDPFTHLDSRVFHCVFLSQSYTKRFYHDIPVYFLPIGICMNSWWTRIKLYKSVRQNLLLFMNFSNKYNPSIKYHSSFMDRFYAQDALYRNGFSMHPQCSFGKMLQKQSIHCFVACPPGIGPDTHRCWEALATDNAIVLNDWEWLRMEFRGILPALFVQKSSKNACTCAQCRQSPIDSTRLDVLIDAFGDVFVNGWGQVTSSNLVGSHRFIGWKRSSQRVRRVLHPSYWAIQIMKKCT